MWTLEAVIASAKALSDRVAIDQKWKLEAVVANAKAPSDRVAIDQK
jgi:hypothetical protein